MPHSLQHRRALNESPNGFRGPLILGGFPAGCLSSVSQFLASLSREACCFLRTLGGCQASGILPSLLPKTLTLMLVSSIPRLAVVTEVSESRVDPNIFTELPTRCPMHLSGLGLATAISQRQIPLHHRALQARSSQNSFTSEGMDVILYYMHCRAY